MTALARRTAIEMPTRPPLENRQQVVGGQHGIAVDPGEMGESGEIIGFDIA